MHYDWTGETIHQRRKGRLVATVVAIAGIGAMAIWMLRLM